MSGQTRGRGFPLSLAFLERSVTLLEGTVAGKRAPVCLCPVVRAHAREQGLLRPLAALKDRISLFPLVCVWFVFLYCCVVFKLSMYSATEWQSKMSNILRAFSTPLPRSPGSFSPSPPSDSPQLLGPQTPASGSSCVLSHSGSRQRWECVSRAGGALRTRGPGCTAAARAPRFFREGRNLDFYVKLV